MLLTTPFHFLATRWARVLPLFLLGAGVHAQSLNWQLAVPRGGTITATVADAAGNLYVAGSFAGTLNLNGTTLVSAGDEDVFVAKWRPDTNAYEWAQRAGGSGRDQALSLAVNGARVYVAGVFSGSAVFGGTTLAGVSGTSNSDGFVARLTDAGAATGFTWAQRAGSEVRAVAASGSNVYVAGNFSGTAGFGTSTLANAGVVDVFVAKLTDAGTTSSFAWAQRAGGPDFDTATSLAVTPAGAIYVAGYYVGGAVFGSTAVPSIGSFDLFVTKLVDAGSTGSFAWTQYGGGPSSDQALAVAVSGSSVYVAGSFTNAATLGPLALANGASGNALVAKLNDAGSSASFTWAQTAGGSGTDVAQALAVAGSDVYVAGYVGGPAAFGGLGTLGAGSFDVFATKLTDAGASASFAWLQTAGGPGDDFASSLAVDPDGRVYVAGTVAPPATFGALTVASSGSARTSFVGVLAAGPLAASKATPLVGLELYPNPAHGRATVQVPAVPGAPIATLTVLDAMGRTLRTQSAATNARAELDLTSLAPGLYAVQVAAGGQLATQRLVVE
jgi:hypothetical protein